jgi:hypothetical protein
MFGLGALQSPPAMSIVSSGTHMLGPFFPHTSAECSAVVYRTRTRVVDTFFNKLKIILTTC